MSYRVAVAALALLASGCASVDQIAYYSIDGAGGDRRESVLSCLTRPPLDAWVWSSPSLAISTRIMRDEESDMFFLALAGKAPIIIDQPTIDIMYADNTELSVHVVRGWDGSQRFDSSVEGPIGPAPVTASEPAKLGTVGRDLMRPPYASITLGFPVAAAELDGASIELPLVRVGDDEITIPKVMVQREIRRRGPSPLSLEPCPPRTYWPT